MGAGLLAVAPTGPPALEIQTRAVQLASVDDLGDPTSAASLADNQQYPLVTWADAYSDTTSNLQSLDAQIAADPNPILSAVDTNLTTMRMCFRRRRNSRAAISRTCCRICRQF